MSSLAIAPWGDRDTLALNCGVIAPSKGHHTCRVRARRITHQRRSGVRLPRRALAWCARLPAPGSGGVLYHCVAVRGRGDAAAAPWPPLRLAPSSASAASVRPPMSARHRGSGIRSVPSLDPWEPWGCPVATASAPAPFSRPPTTGRECCPWQRSALLPCCATIAHSAVRAGCVRASRGTEALAGCAVMAGSDACNPAKSPIADSARSPSRGSGFAPAQETAATDEPGGRLRPMRHYGRPRHVTRAECRADG